ncbi:Nitroreductase [Humidesulfovibrio mexicanus]|uniref:Nitroreductase n=1 Tax=Humidesulfovibrio mexicanus TaxID=147047 RepID=A0A238Z8N8_9BACT|nr:nitroreductase family protein [Humidesulfovibrio mexicanus]SNR79213.1 Nitroreductase [Humidesulfovibrio mexicanus]
MDVMDAILTRRSIRKYAEGPVTDEQLRTLLSAAMAAPSAGNQQPWQFVVVRQPALLAEVSRIHPHVHMAAKAPAGILVCGDTRVEKYPGYWVIDCAAAVQNLLLAAHGLGLGAVWTGIHPVQERVEAFAKLFGAPAGVVPHSFIPIGRPAEERRSEDRFRPERIHQERFPA